MEASGMKAGRWERILWGAAAVAGLCAGLASAQPAPDPIVDRQWSRFVGVRKLDPAQHPHHNGALAAWNTADSVFLLPFDYSMCLIACGDCGFLGRKPHAFRLLLPADIPGHESVPFSVVSQSGARIYPEGGAVRASVVFAFPDGMLLRLRVAWNEVGKVTREIWDAANLKALANGKFPSPKVIFAAADFGDPVDSGFVVLGDDGYGRRVEWKEGGLKETVLALPDIDITARGGRFVGTASGEIYAFDAFPHLTLEGKALPGPIDAVDSSGAVSGRAFAYRIGSRWLTDPATDGMRPRSWATEWDGSGLRASIWGGAGANAATVRLQDSPTTLRSLTPAAVFALLNNGRYHYYQPQGTLEIKADLIDIDGNYDALRILRIRDRDTAVITAEMRKTVPGNGEGQWPAREDGCAGDGVCLKGRSVPIAIRVGPDSLRVRMPVFKGALDKECPNMPYFRGVPVEEYHLAADLRVSDRFVFLFGMDALEIIVSFEMALTPLKTGAATRSDLASAFDAAGRDLAPRPGGNPVKGISPVTPRFRR